MTGMMTRQELSSHSRFAQRVQRRYEQQLHLLPAGVPNQASMAELCKALQAQGFDLGSALRTTRQLVLERLLQLDCNENAPLASITLARMATDTITGLAQGACPERTDSA